MLIKFISNILTDCRARYTENFIVYPLPIVDELQGLIENFRLILVQVEASSLIRYQRAQQKYAIKDLETFLKIDHEFMVLFCKNH